MQRRLTVLAAMISGALAAVAALPLVTSSLHRPQAASALAADAQAAASGPVASPTTTAETLRQAGPMPSLAPIVKQLRPVVVNINSRFKPRRIAQRGRGLPQVRPGPNDGDNGDGNDEEH